MAASYLRRTSSALPIGLALWLAVGIGLSAALAASTGTFRDNFDSVSYSGSNGSLGWSGAWIEEGESDGAAAGRARVVIDAKCAAGGCGYLTAGSTATVSLRRAADLSGATSATLTFSHRRTKIGTKAGLVRVSVSSNGGASWATMATYTLDVTDETSINKSLNILTFATAQTQIRFQVESTAGQSGRYHFDGVQISATFPDSTTTTTTTTTNPPATTTTTTSPPSTTSTSLPPSSTTTTTAPPTSTTGPPITLTPTTVVVVTTTLPPTSTVPPSPTTTVAGNPTTTVAGGAPTTTLVAAPPVELGGGQGFPVFPVAALPRGTAAPLLAPATDSIDPEVSSLVRMESGSAVAMAAGSGLQSVGEAAAGDTAPGLLTLAWPTALGLTGLSLASSVRRRRTAWLKAR
jgi:hypothetical protein